MHTLKVTLKQHTPLIHFQHDQDGATLRASEVKPKLDRYILTKLGGDEGYKKGIEIAKQKGWLVGKGEHPALDYKMRIEAEGRKIEYLLASYIKDEKILWLENDGIKAISNTPFFAQEKQNSQVIRSRNRKEDWDSIDKKGVLREGNIVAEILVKNDDLISIINAKIQSFFTTFNFGTRQSKGFGCFSVSKVGLNGRDQAIDSYESLLKDNFAFVYKKTLNNSTLSNILSTINNDYKLLKSGRTRPYAKSKLMLYAESLNPKIGWDKKYIKVMTNDVFYTENNDDCYLLKCDSRNRKYNYEEKDDYLYYRAVLGLAEQFEFLLENPPCNDEHNKMIVKVKSADIQRYQSPLMFKVVDSDVYITGNDVFDGVLNKNFNFLINFQKDNRYKDEPIEEGDKSIFTPGTFSLKKFIAFAMKDNTNNASLNYQTIKG